MTRVLPLTTRTPSVEFRAPLVDLHVYPPVQKEPHSLALQESALRTGVANPEVRAAGSALLDDPVTGDTGPVGIVVHRPPHGAGRARRPKHSCDLAVRGHPSPGNPGHQGVHAREEAVSPLPLRGLAGLPPPPTLLSCRGHRLSSPSTPRPRAEAQPGAPGPRAIIQASHPKSRWRRLEPSRPPLAGVMTSKNALQTAGRRGNSMAAISAPQTLVGPSLSASEDGAVLPSERTVRARCAEGSRGGADTYTDAGS
jgi:hypothetical protein